MNNAPILLLISCLAPVAGSVALADEPAKKKPACCIVANRKKVQGKYGVVIQTSVATQR